jgi:hypothetical protein
MASQQQRHFFFFYFFIAARLFLSEQPSSVAVNAQTVSGAFCGKTWSHAISSCNRPCPSGAPTQCLEGEICFAGTPCSLLLLNNNVPSGRPTPFQQQQQSSLPWQTTQQTTTVSNTNNNVNNVNSNSPLYNTVATCGNGSIGNGLCSKINECCSTFGFCGVSDSHCSNRAPVSGTTNPNIAAGSMQQQQQQGTAATTGTAGTCGGGSIGNAICPNNDECCSQYGFCGTTLEHCLGKVGNDDLGTEYTGGGAGNSQVGNSQVGDNNQMMGGGVPVQRPNDVTTNTNAASGPTVVTTMGNVEYNGGGNPETTTIQGGGGGGGGSSTTTTSSSATAAAVTPHGTNKKIIGYYAGWQWYDRNKLADPTNLDFRKLQRVNYAFFQFDTQGELYGIDRWGDPQVLFGPYSSMLGGGVQKCSYDGPNDVNCGYHEHNEGLIYRAHQAGAEVYPSVGGWTLSDNFPTVSANPAARENFAENCLKILEYYQFDGVSYPFSSCYRLSLSVCVCIMFMHFRR